LRNGGEPWFSEQAPTERMLAKAHQQERNSTGTNGLS